MDFSVIRLDRIDSTQSYLFSLDSEQSLREGTCVISRKQYDGRGQGQNVWECEDDKNIVFSILLQPHFLHPSEQFAITQCMSLSIVDFLACYIDGNIWIKWPNDVYVGREKICGMLIQNKLMGSLFAKSFCGIGININQKSFCVAPNPTSLALQTGMEYDIESLMDNLFKSIDNRYEQLRNDQKEALQEDYLNHLLYRNIWAEYVYKGERIKAMILGVNSFGHLIFQDESCEIHTAELKELVFTHSDFEE